jgi:aminoglycoside 3-N-acetyltransferase
VPKTKNRFQLLDSHVQAISDLVQGRELWIPTFNYDFLSTGSFSPASDPSQVGSLNEEFRKRAAWRTNVPVFNFCGLGEIPIGTNLEPVVDPFDQMSVFAELVRHDGSILWYGAPFSSATFLHHVESVAGGPLYRYDKFFDGVVSTLESTKNVTLKYHVRPLAGPVEYDWEKIVEDSVQDGAIGKVEGTENHPIFSGSARHILQSWQQRLHADPFYLLDRKSRSWIEPRVQALGRRFQIEDFEAQTNDSS